MKRTIFAIITFICFLPVFGQEAEEGIVTYVDSVPQNMTYRMSKIGQKVQSRIETEKQKLYSRENKIIVEYEDNYFMCDAVLLCMQMAIDSWESKISIETPILFDLALSEELDSDIEIKTDVEYSLGNREAVPLSLYYQNHITNPIPSSGEITLNAQIDWDSSWLDDNIMGHDNLTTALLRHVAHILGFGITAVERDGGWGFSVGGRFTSKYDKLVSNGQRTLASLAGKPSADFEDFFKGNLFLKLPSVSYPLYSSTDGYIPFRTGNYFNLDEDNLLNYPYRDTKKLFPINRETLDVMAAIGWTVKPYDVEIMGTELDVNGYGSMYQSHKFTARDGNGNNISNATWHYQLYDGAGYVTKQSGQGASFTVTPNIEADKYNDGFLRQQARICCSFIEQGQTRQYFHPLYLEQRPLFVSYEISNVDGNTTNDTYSFDIKLNCLGADYGYLYVCNDYGISLNYNIGSGNETDIHVSNAYKYGLAWLDISLYNSFGTTTRRFYLDAYPNIHSIESLSVQSMGESLNENINGISVYTLNGVKLDGLTNLKNLPRGEYIINSKIKSWKSRKYIVR